MLSTVLVAGAVVGFEMSTELGCSPGAVFLLLPVLSSAFLAGLGAGLMTTGISTAVVIWQSRSDIAWQHAIGVVIVGAAISAMIEALHQSRQREVVAARESDQAQQRCTQLFYNSPVAQSLSRISDGVVIAVNDTYLEQFGIERIDIIGTVPASAGIHPPAGLRDEVFAKVAAGQELRDYEAEFDTPRGRRSLTLRSTGVELDGGCHVLTTFVDTSDHKRALAEATELEARFRQLSENIHEVFWLADNGNARTLYVSPTFEKIFGRPCSALYADPDEWLRVVHPDDLARMKEESSKHIDEPVEHTFRILKGREIRTIHSSIFPVHDAEGRAIRIAGVAEDITQHLHLEEQVRQTQKLESLGLLAGGVAHDFNNVLAVIGANVGLLTVPADHPDREIVDDIEAAVARASALTRQLLAFSRKEVVDPVVLDVNSAIADTRKMLRRMVGEDIVIETSLEPELLRVKIDPGHFVQVLMNIAVNARDAMPIGGAFSIATRNIGEEVVVELSDTGTGMPPEVASRVFEPFFTTKGVGRGTGLGLSVVHGIVQQAGGRIEIDSKLGAGTTFRVCFPAVTEAPERISDVALTAVQGHEKIVLVDDDVFVRRATSRALRSRGYAVLEAGDAKAALRILEEHDREISLLVTDVVMPGMDGRELVERARRSRPTLKVLYMSGHTDDAVLRHGVEHDHVPFLEKPFPGHALAGKVRHLLDRV